MPTYDYVCDSCGHSFELFQSITAEPETKCPECRKKKLRRLFGTGAAVVFKGSGFYQTDYRSKSYQEKAAAEAKAQGDKAQGDKKAPDSGAAGSESKPTPKKEKKESPSSTA
jgi:putative FmdB family regulatory protein